MISEIFKVTIPARFYVFVVAQNVERLGAFETALRGLGGTVAGPQAFWLAGDRTSPEGIRDALGELEEGECVYVIGAGSEGLENHMIVAPRMEGGVKVRKS